jgi:hypothetical protein
MAPPERFLELKKERRERAKNASARSYFSLRGDSHLLSHYGIHPHPYLPLLSPRSSFFPLCLNSPQPAKDSKKAPAKAPKAEKGGSGKAKKKV